MHRQMEQNTIIMTINNLERVMWRIRKKHPNQKKITWLQLKRAIMHECGTSDRTYFSNKKALRQLGWIKPHGKNKFIITDKDLEEG